MMSRSVSRMTVFAVAVLLLSGTFAQAAVIGTTALVRQPPGTLFASPEAALPSPWVGYTLGLASTAGELIGGVDVSINGTFHQRWVDGEDPDTGDPIVVSTPNSPNATSGDSHLRAVTGALFGSGPDEDNSFAGSPLPNAAPNTYGVGSFLKGAWGITNALTTANLAYIVIPFGSQVSTDIRVSIANPQGEIIGVLNSNDFPGFEQLPPNETPIVGDNEVEYTSMHPSTIVSETLPLVDDNPTGGVWALDSFVSPNGQAASVDPVTGLFSWLGNGSPEGHYNAVLKFTDVGGLSDTGTLGITWHIPEPTSLVLFGLALVGFAGFRRK